ncbi:uncharacterized protein BJ212DRAFT_1297237 [Suillus subaureus]|uniref:Cation-transporting P-type ATPase N-terminal domain-containing protein n=1 Tax=Suillus subaureus TaxID=48587 RepID=A0A9P7EIM7_9AGAM|nr:uncharacterized protein BJ212DRAFT_1297237 [Suillus subaureus]KAG1821972.1 hypothetical protein BJ212DRAFT_1297237 [Suillus subaureus]
MLDTIPSPDPDRGFGKGYGIQIALYVLFASLPLALPPAWYIADLTTNRYRTLPGHVEEKQTTSKSSPDPADIIGSIDAHLLSIDEVYNRYSSHPTVGLELAVSSPTVYWKKTLDYIFGGFNFLMWISFILTILSYKPLGPPVPLTLGMRVVAVVNRDGNQQIIKAADIVVGDVAVLNAGDRVPADMRVVQASSNLRFDRSLLTGESKMVPGALDATCDNALETRNLALTSTFVVQGTCHGVVFATGDRTVMGRLIKMSGETKFKLTTIQREVWFFTKVISYVAIFFFCLSILLYGVWLRTSYPGYDTSSSAIVNSIGCLTAFVLQGLPSCVALSLSVVARRMAKRQVLVKNLATIKTLGCMSVLCSDKTGTLTAGKMVVGNIAFLDDVFGVEEINERAMKASDPTGGSYAQFMAIIANVLLGMQLPLNSYQQTCYSITNDVIMSISLMYEKPEWDLMQRKPRNARTDRLTGWRFFFISTCFYKVILTFNQWEDGWQDYTLAQLTQFVDVGQGIYYVTVAIGQCGTLLAVSNRRVSILHSNPLWGPRRNLLVLVGMTGTILICIANLYGAGFQRVFGTTPIPGMFWGLPFTFALGILLMDETRKAIVRKYPKSFIAWLAW